MAQTIVAVHTHTHTRIDSNLIKKNKEIAVSVVSKKFVIKEYVI